MSSPETNQEMEEDEYVIEKIVNKRSKDGQFEYLVKWQGYEDADNTWEPASALNCQDMIDRFEEELRKTAKKHADSEPVDKTISKKKKIRNSNSNSQALNGFDRGLVPKKILGATNTTGEIMFLMKWKNSDEYELVPSRIANVKCPQLVIKFYSARSIWSNADSPDPSTSST